MLFDLVRSASGELYLPERPVTAITSVTASGVLLAPTSYVWTGDGVLRHAWASQWGGEVTVVYTHGYPAGHPVRVGLAAWVAARVARLLVRQVTNPDQVRSETIAGYSVAYLDENIAASSALTVDDTRDVDRIMRRTRAGTIRVPTPDRHGRSIWPSWVANAAEPL